MEKGFTLLEVMLTMFIITIGLLATARLLFVTVEQNNKSEVRIDSSATVQAMLYDAEAVLLSSPNPVVTCSGLADAALARAKLKPKSYMNLDYIETVSCTELNSGFEQFMITAKIAKVGGIVPGGIVLAERSTMITTVKPANK